ncbi:MAG TPA: FliI/YscN family ATPase [Candidatus Aquilonibacter sp.]|nr:FliI/YscN family ATPase [Candidatus Aquilonibacter sp.]
MLPRNTKTGLEASPSDKLLGSYFSQVERSSGLRWQGRVKQVIGPLVESEGPFCSVGEMCEITDSCGRTLPGEIVGFRDQIVLSMPLELPQGIRYGDRVTSWGERPSIRVGAGLLGRVVDGNAQPLDQAGPYRGSAYRRLDAAAPSPLERIPISEPLGCGIRAIDGFLTCGRGQRVGIFGGSGVGKSTLIGMMARNTSADITVLGLVGERGREVRDFLENSLGTEGCQRACVVVSTSDQSPLLRIRAALAATAVAEYFCGQGKHVLLVVDSLTRMAMAQREIGLAAGEPPTAKGYTPSCFNMLARLIERAGRFGAGSITAFYTVLMEGDDEQDPLVDGARALLDGHVMLDRKLAVRSHFPPIAVLNSVSRLMSSVAVPAHLQKAQNLRRLLAAYSASEDLIRIGAYQKGSDSTLDKALTLIPELDQFLMQKPGEPAPIADTIQRLLALPG